MATQLSSEEMGQETEIERGQDREVTVTFRISAEALDALVPRNTTARQLNEAKTLLLACGLYSYIQDIRELQSTEKIVTHDAGGTALIPAVRRKETLRMAGRYAQVALTHLETVALWAGKAAIYIR